MIINFKLIQKLIQSKYKKDWEWQPSNRVAEGRQYMLKVWLSLDRSDPANAVTVYATTKNNLWTADVWYLAEGAPTSLPDSSREIAVDNAYKLWVKFLKSKNS